MDPLVSQGISLAWHSIRRTLSVLATLLVVAGIAWSIYVAFVRPTTKPNATTRQEAEKIDNVNYEITPKPMFGGCVSLQIRQEKKNDSD